MSKVAGISLLFLGASAVAYPFLIKKENKLTNEDVLISKGQESTCDLLNVKLDLIMSEMKSISPEWQMLYILKDKTSEQEKRFAFLMSKIKPLSEQRDILLNQIKKSCSNFSKAQGSDCLSLDASIKEFTDKIDQYSKDILKPIGSTALSKEAMKKLIEKYNIELLKRKNEFEEKSCRDYIEKKRLNESGYLISTQSEKQEKNVLSSNYKEQYIYIGLGSVVILTGLYIISKK